MKGETASQQIQLNDTVKDACLKHLALNLNLNIETTREFLTLNYYPLTYLNQEKDYIEIFLLNVLGKC
jgi:hypothetical protein